MAVKKRGRPEPTMKRKPLRSKVTAQAEAPSSSDEEFPETIFDDDVSPSEASDAESVVEVSADEEDLPHIFLGDRPDNVEPSDAESHSDADSTELLDIDSDSEEDEEEMTGDDSSGLDDGEDEKEEDSAASDYESTLISSADEVATVASEPSKPKRRTKVNWDTYVEERKTLPEIDADYASDSSTEDPVNTVGKIPMEWYDDYPHIGYDIDGKRIMRPATKDELDKFLDTVDDPDKMISAPSQLAQQDMKLSDYELEIIKRLQRGYFPDATYDPYEPTVEYFTSQVLEQPLPAPTEPKRRFLPSKWEHQRIAKIVQSIRAGRIVLNRAPVEKPQFYDLWGAADGDSQDPIRGISQHMPAPKVTLPGHAESYHPPREYLLTPEEVEQVKQRAEDKGDLSAVAQLPKDHTSLRKVPAYPRLIQERFQRCLDLYLCPRKLAKRTDADPESLVPKLPDPKDLHPYPTTMAMAYRGHTGM
ncbi:Ribosome biogenesis protein erb1, partial [Dimargaris verticillata]